MQAFFLVPLPPNLGLSTQARHWPQSSLVQPSHSPHLSIKFKKKTFLKCQLSRFATKVFVLMNKKYFLLSELVKFLSLSNPIHCSDWGYAQIIFPAGFASQEGGVSIRMLFEFDENAYVLL